MRKTIVFIFLLMLFTLSHVHAWDNPNKPLVNTGVYASKNVTDHAFS